jgi:hypothetical protein
MADGGDEIITQGFLFVLVMQLLSVVELGRKRHDQ